MHIVVDGLIFQYQKIGGISRLFAEILPEMCDLEHGLRITLFYAGRCQQRLPCHPSICHRSLFPVDDIFRPQRLWWPILQKAREFIKGNSINRLGEDIWHSTYYTRLESWEKPKVVTVYDMIYERYPYFFSGKQNDRFRLIKKLCIEEAQHIICISDTTKKDVLDFYNVEDSKISVIPLAASHVFRQLGKNELSLGGLISKPFIMYVGARGYYKNFNAVVRAYGLWALRKEIDLVVVGPEWSQFEREMQKEYGITEQVKLFINIDDHDLCSLYNRAVALVYPSLYEGFGIPLLEAMACGCPVVASHIPSTIEVMGENAVYFEPSEINEVVDALNIVEREGRTSEIVKNCLENVKRYSWRDTALHTLSVYHKLVR